MRRPLIVLLAALGALIISMQSAVAGSPHFIKSSLSVSVSGNTLTVSGKEAGLGDEDQVHIVLSATAECINPGDHHPKAANKTDVSGSGDFPVQNGKADFTLSVTASFQPNCAGPMTIVYVDVSLTDTTNGITANI
jgi:hypothetical protein